MKNDIINRLDEIINVIYPVGSIYMSVNDTSPQSFFGGTWAKIEGRFLLSSSSSYSTGATGGEATHKLTTAEMPSHTHTFTGTAASHSHTSKIYTANNSKYTMSISAIRLPFNVGEWVDMSTSSDITTAGGTGGDPCGITSSTSITPKGTNSNTGSNSAHNNMPPYFVVNMWKRTA